METIQYHCKGGKQEVPKDERKVRDRNAHTNGHDLVPTSSSWLKKNQSGSTRMSRWVWAAAIIILLVRCHSSLWCLQGLITRQCIAAGVAATLITTHGKSSPQQPTALGGSANETSSSMPSKSTATSRPSVRSHISPTHTVARRDVNSDAFPTVTSIRHRQIPDHPRYHRRRLGVALPE